MQLHHQKMSAFSAFLQFVIILQVFRVASCRWCTKLKEEKTVQQVLEMGECSQKYQAKCSWFSSTLCTYYEKVPCHKERNHTVVQYKIVSECCHGYRLDPVNNITCVRIPGTHDHGVQYFVSDDGLFLGLSPGEYAGIFCSFMFVSCVIILVTLRILKRKQQIIKANEVKVTDMEMSEKMIHPIKA